MNARIEAADAEYRRTFQIPAMPTMMRTEAILNAADEAERGLADQLAAALEFYANEKRWEDGFLTERVETNRDAYGSEVDYTAIPDDGARARDALARFHETQERAARRNEATREWWFTSQSSVRTHLWTGRGSETACGRPIHLDAERDDSNPLRCSRCVKIDTAAARVFPQPQEGK